MKATLLGIGLWLAALCGGLQAASYTVPNTGTNGGGGVATLTPWTSDINAAAYSLTNVASVSTVGTNGGALDLNATNGTGKVTLSVHKDLVHVVTNIIGLWELPAASVVEFDKNKGDKFNVTNSISANFAGVWTNFVKGQRMSGRIRGNASTPYTVTFTAHLGATIANLNDLSATAATSYSETLTNGNSLEWDAEMDKQNGTNAAFVVTRQYKTP